MQDAMTMASAGSASPAAGHTAHQMPLTFLSANESARVVKVRGTDEMHHHLENLGFVSGAPIRVVAKQGSGLIVEVKGAQVALDRSVASKIIAA